MSSILKKIINRETITYIIFGVLTTLVNVGVYTLLCYVMPYAAANLIALIAAKGFAYITNKIFVFQSRNKKAVENIKELLKFIFARGFTGVLDYFGLILMVSVLGMNKLISKYILQIIVQI